MLSNTTYYYLFIYFYMSAIQLRTQYYRLVKKIRRVQLLKILTYMIVVLI